MPSLKNKIILWLGLLSFSILIALYYFIPYSTKENVRSILVSNAKQMVEQMKLTRSYYLQNVVSNIKNEKSKFKFVAQHKEDNFKLPLPSTMIHDLSSLYTQKTGIGFRTYSYLPFKNREDRILSMQDKEILEKIKETPNGIYIFENTEERAILKVAVADFMNDISCVECHNNHPDRTWEKDKWNLNDIRGVIEISMPLDEPLAQISQIKNTILWSMGIIFLVFMVYYSILYLKREDELLERNKELDKKVAIEIEKNKEKEQILIQKSKLSSMGEMLNNISHQWRQPLSELSSILMNIEMRYSHDKLDKTFMTQKMKKAENLLNYLSYTIDDFKNFFAPTKEKERFNLSELIQSTVNISNMEIELSTDKEIFLFGYPTELSQVLLNILSNAKDAFISNDTKNNKLSIISTKDENTIYITVSDNAGGIKAQDIEDIFKLYYTEKKNGSGIGLYMSRLIIEKHFNGNLRAFNAKNGATFEIALIRE